MSTKNDRTFDENGMVRRAGCLIFKDINHHELLLVTSSRGYFIAPAGGIEPNESIPDAAIREAKEEAGVNGILGPYLGVFINSKRTSITEMYVMYANDLLPNTEWMESHLRKRVWIKRTLLKSDIPSQEDVKISPALSEYLDLFDSVHHKFNPGILVSKT